jgi:hypothetical protein
MLRYPSKEEPVMNLNPPRGIRSQYSTEPYGTIENNMHDAIESIPSPGDELETSFRQNVGDRRCIGEPRQRSISLPRSLFSIFLIVVVDVMGMSIILPLLPFYTARMGASASTVGILVSLFASCQLLASPVLGYLSDRHGRKPILIQLASF